jgi:hypothetical protein
MIFFAAVVSPKMFRQKTLLDFRKSGKVNGVVLLGVNASDPDLEVPAGYSDDDVCPNNPGSLYTPIDSAFCQADRVRSLFDTMYYQFRAWR